MEIFYIIWFFIAGTVFGSFYNVAGYRLPKKMSIVKPNSHCPNCKHMLSPLELIPIVSYVIQKGKCKNCKTKIPIFYPIFETLTGLLFVLTYLIFGFSWQILIAITFISVLIIVMISDFKYMIIPDELLLVGGALLIVQKFFINGSQDVINSLISGFIAFLVILFIKLLGDFLFKKESMGGGDLKLMFFIGLCLPLPISILPIFLGTCIALPISLLTLFVNKENILPFGPYLSISAIILFLYQVTPTQFYDFLLMYS